MRAEVTQAGGRFPACQVGQELMATSVFPDLNLPSLAFAAMDLPQILLPLLLSLP